MGRAGAARLTGMQTSGATDEAFMDRALAAARGASEAGEVPVGAVVVRDDAVIGTGANGPIARHDPTAHAEIVALREAAAWCGNYRLPGVTLYVTLEPCCMCVGAMIHARVERLVFGASDPRTGAAGSRFDLAQSSRHNHRLAVTSGIRAEACGEVLRAFFRARRATG